MTDGENNSGVPADLFRQDFKIYPAAVAAVHTYPVLFGDASKAEMTDLATQTGGTVFDATATSLQTIFKQIRGYQ